MNYKQAMKWTKKHRKGLHSHTFTGAHTEEKPHRKGQDIGKLTRTAKEYRAMSMVICAVCRIKVARADGIAEWEVIGSVYICPACKPLAGGG
ncbi:hypothetical protein LCGC14_1369570 [marine sediment metagenome]|uniref:Uncharacterized protein n=1 Tax=marine sediment metagenome TaxID=412755 RepID=A0A0F9K5W0_9ZZZZ